MSKVGYPIVFTRNSSFSILFSITLLALATGGCVDDVIEGASTKATAFAATKATSSFTTLNTCSTTSGAGTSFSVKIDLAGSDAVDFVSGRYKFSNQTSYTEVSSVAYIQTGGSGSSSGFRTPTKASVANYITASHCVRFGTVATSIEFVYDIYSALGKTVTISTVITKPAGAN